MGARKRHFAIGLKGWVQIRVGTKPPKGTASEAVVEVKERKITWVVDNELYGHYDTVYVPATHVLKSILYEGGRTVATVKADRFKRVLGITLKDDILMELLPDQVTQLKLGEQAI